jgi:putative Mg2+ transporter-C (MgtC) family protein
MAAQPGAASRRAGTCISAPGAERLATNKTGPEGESGDLRLEFFYQPRQAGDLSCLSRARVTDSCFKFRSVLGALVEPADKAEQLLRADDNAVSLWVCQCACGFSASGGSILGYRRLLREHFAAELTRRIEWRALAGVRVMRSNRPGLSGMAFLHSFALGDFLDSMVSLFAAFVLGTLIGAERQYRQRGGGLRTHVLVAVGAATFVDIGQHLNGNAGATQIIAYVVSGVGFLGAGVIMKQGSSVWGLNTAATLWCSAAVGACAGADLAIEATALTGFVLAGNTLLRPLVNAINRAPIKQSATEAIYEVRLTTSADHVDDARELLREQLEAGDYPLRSLEIEEQERGDDAELVATLLSTAADPHELDAIVTRLEASPLVENASWALRTTE